jgi:hypothetical protein
VNEQGRRDVSETNKVTPIENIVRHPMVHFYFGLQSERGLIDLRRPDADLPLNEADDDLIR